MSNVSQEENRIGATEKQVKNQRIMIVLQIKYAVWLPFYLKTMVLFCRTFGIYPDATKVTQTIRKGITLVHVPTQKRKGFRGRLVNLTHPYSNPWGVVKSL